jgi:hypothetical protein
MAALFAISPFVLSGCMEERVQAPSAARASANQSAEQSELSCVRFNTPLNYDKLAQEARQYNLNPTSIRIDFGDFSSEYTLGTRSMQEAKNDFFTKHEEFLKLMLERAHVEQGAGSEGEQNLARFSQLLSEAKVGKVLVTGARFTTLPIPAERIGGRIVTPDSIDAPRSSSGKIPESNGTLSTSHESWAPYTGWSKVTQGQTYQEFYFNNLSSFGSSNTYEHETQVYDRNFADYANYTSSNMPSWYYDTPFLDSIDNFTVGTFHADQLAAYYKYWTYMALKAGSVSSTTCHIKGQLGHRSPSWCYSTWCVWADATTGSMAYLAIPNYGVTWTY